MNNSYLLKMVIIGFTNFIERNLKNEIFDIFESARILFNDYYNGKNEYQEKDIRAIYDLITSLQINIDEVKDIIKECEGIGLYI